MAVSSRWGAEQNVTQCGEGQPKLKRKSVYLLCQVPSLALRKICSQNKWKCMWKFLPSSRKTLHGNIMPLKRPLRHDLELQSPSGQRYSRPLLPFLSLYCKAATLSSGAHNIKTNFQTIKPDHHYSYKPSGGRGTVANGRYCHPVDKGMTTATALIAPFTVTRGRGRTTIREPAVSSL